MVAVAPRDERPVADEPAAPRARIDWPVWLEHGAVVAALLWWAWPLTSRIGGRGPGALAIGCALTFVAFVLQRPWRRLPAYAGVLGALVSLSALLICVFTPVGFARTDSAVNYVYSVAIGLTAWCYARTPGRRELLVGAILVAGMREFAGAFFAWWGHGTSAVSMNGDFPWRNSYAAFLVAPAVLGAACAVRGRGPLRYLGWVAAPVCLAGVVFSTSRAALAVVIVGWLAVGVFAFRAPTRGRLVSWLLVAVASVGFVYVLAGPPVFPHRASPFAALDQRSADGETLANNGRYRVEFWQEAIAAFASRPTVGVGYQEMAAVSFGRKPASWPRAPLAHNSYLQPLADGGLLLAIPVLISCLALGVALAGSGISRLVRHPRDDLVLGVAEVTGLLLMAHAAIDFDWTQPANLAMFGLVAAVALSTRRATADVQKRAPARAVGSAALIALLAFSAYAAHHWDGVNDVRSHPITPAVAGQFVAIAEHPLHDYRPAVQVLSAYNSGQSLPQSLVRRALAATGGIAKEDRGIAMVRAQSLALLGDRAGAVRAVDSALASLGDAEPGYWAPAGRALVAAGETARGRALFVRAADFAARHGVAPIYWSAVNGLLTVDGQPTAADRCAVSAGIDRFGPPPSDPVFAGLTAVPGCVPLPPSATG
jgi:hypothetical protein